MIERRGGGARAGEDRPDIVGTKAEIETGDELKLRQREQRRRREGRMCAGGNEQGENE